MVIHLPLPPHPQLDPRIILTIIQPNKHFLCRPKEKKKSLFTPTVCQELKNREELAWTSVHKYLLPLLTNWVAVAGQTSLLTPEAVEAVPAPLAVGTVGVILAAHAVATVACRAVQLRIEVALLGPPIAVTSCRKRVSSMSGVCGYPEPSHHKTHYTQLNIQLGEGTLNHPETFVQQWEERGKNVFLQQLQVQGCNDEMGLMSQTSTQLHQLSAQTSSTSFPPSLRGG